MRTHQGFACMIWTALAGLLAASGVGLAQEQNVVKYARFRVGQERPVYGIVEGDVIRQIDGSLFANWKKTDKTYPLSSVTLLAPSRPTQVLAMAGNYRSHIPGEVIPEKLRIPQAFFKTPQCIVGPNDAIVIPHGTKDVHYEGELVIVIGKRAKNVSKEDALKYVLGVTCGNDVSARDWQKNDIQWWRAKGSDTFGPCGPMIVSGLNYDDLLLQLRLNGEVKQKERTKNLIHNVPTMVSFLSQHLTLNPGDLIYTGTPGITTAMKPGDEVEVEIEGIGVLRNRVAAAP